MKYIRNNDSKDITLKVKEGNKERKFVFPDKELLPLTGGELTLLQSNPQFNRMTKELRLTETKMPFLTYEDKFVCYLEKFEFTRSDGVFGVWLKAPQLAGESFLALYSVDGGDIREEMNSFDDNGEAFSAIDSGDIIEFAIYNDYISTGDYPMRYSNRYRVNTIGL